MAVKIPDALYTALFNELVKRAGDPGGLETFVPPAIIAGLAYGGSAQVRALAALDALAAAQMPGDPNGPLTFLHQRLTLVGAGVAGALGDFLKTPVFIEAVVVVPAKRTYTDSIEARKQLQTFMLKAFNAFDVKQLVRGLTDGDTLVHGMPLDGTPFLQLVAATIELLVQNGAVDEAFFEAMRTARERRIPEIDAVEGAWLK